MIYETWPRPSLGGAFYAHAELPAVRAIQAHEPVCLRWRSPAPRSMRRRLAPQVAGSCQACDADHTPPKLHGPTLRSQKEWSHHQPRGHPMPLQAGFRAAMAAAICLVLQSAGLAHDGPHKHWLESLRRPDVNQSCCGEADIVKTKFKVENTGGPYPEDRWYAWLNESMDADPASENPPGVCSERRSLSVRGWRHHPVLRAAQGRHLKGRGVHHRVRPGRWDGAPELVAECRLPAPPSIRLRGRS